MKEAIGTRKTPMLEIYGIPIILSHSIDEPLKQYRFPKSKKVEER